MPTYDGSGFDSQAVLKRSYDDWSREWQRMTPEAREAHARRVGEGLAMVLAYFAAAD